MIIDCYFMSVPFFVLELDARGTQPSRARPRYVRQYFCVALVSWYKVRIVGSKTCKISSSVVSFVTLHNASCVCPQDIFIKLIFHSI